MSFLEFHARPRTIPRTQHFTAENFFKNSRLLFRPVLGLPTETEISAHRPQCHRPCTGSCVRAKLLTWPRSNTTAGSTELIRKYKAELFVTPDRYERGRSQKPNRGRYVSREIYMLHWLSLLHFFKFYNLIENTTGQLESRQWGRHVSGRFFHPFCFMTNRFRKNTQNRSWTFNNLQKPAWTAEPLFALENTNEIFSFRPLHSAGLNCTSIQRSSFRVDVICRNYYEMSRTINLPSKFLLN